MDLDTRLRHVGQMLDDAAENISTRTLPSHAPRPRGGTEPPRRRLVPLMTAAGVAVAVLAIAVVVVRSNEPSRLDVTNSGPAPLSTPPTQIADDDAGASAPGTPPTESSPVVEADDALVLEPEGPYRDGQAVALRRPEGYVQDWANELPRFCAVVADGGGDLIETCDPLGLTSANPVSATQVDLVLSQRIFTPSGYRDCAEPAVTCRLVQRRANGAERATAPIQFQGSANADRTRLAVAATDDPHQFVIEPDSLEAHPSWLALREQHPERVIGYPAFSVQVCAFGSSTPDVAPYGKYLWLTWESEVPWENCNTNWQAASIDPDDPDAPVTMSIEGRLHGYRGWSDCRVDVCFVVIRTSIVDAVSSEAVTGYDIGVAAALVPFDPTVGISDPPSIQVLATGPFDEGQSITVEIRGLPDGTDTNVGVCSVEDPWACRYAESAFGLSNGIHEFELPAYVSECGPQQCYLELDAQGEGLPPLATTPLNTAR